MTSQPETNPRGRDLGAVNEKDGLFLISPAFEKALDWAASSLFRLSARATSADRADVGSVLNRLAVQVRAIPSLAEPTKTGKAEIQEESSKTLDAVPALTAASSEAKRPEVDSLRVWPKFFEAIRRGEKTFEARFRGENEPEIVVGQSLLLREWNPDSGTYTGRALPVEVRGAYEASGVIGPFVFNRIYSIAIETASSRPSLEDSVGFIATVLARAVALREGYRVVSVEDSERLLAIAEDLIPKLDASTEAIR